MSDPASPAAPPAPAAPRTRLPWRKEAAPPLRLCPNCGTLVSNRYCAACGQRNADRLVSLRRMAADLVEDQLSLNATLPRTLGGLLFRPGHLSREFVAGRIARYVPPFRVFLFSSLAFFIALSFVADPERLSNQLELSMSAESAPAAARAAAEREGADRAAGPAVERSGNHNVNLNVDTAAAPGWLKPLARRLQRQQDRLNAMSTREALRLMIQGGEETAARAAFVLVPLFAALLKLLFLREKRLYVEHFVFALHVHSFVFVLTTLALVVPVPGVRAATLVWMAVYLFLAMKRFYAQGWFRTLFKFLTLGASYLFVLFWAMLVIGVVALLTV